MKKLLAITVIFALVAGAAFAETSFGGGGKLGTTLMHGYGGETIQGNQFTEDDGVGGLWWQAGNLMKDGSLDFSTSGDNAGAVLRFWPSAVGNWWGNAWWQPIDMLKVEFHKKDGEWGHAQIVDWGYIGGPQDLVAMQDSWNDGFVKIPNLSNLAGHTGFGFGMNQALLLHITPVDNVLIGIGIPILDGAKDAEDIYLRSLLTARVGLDGIGTIRASVKFGPGRNDRLGTGNFNDMYTKYAKGKVNADYIKDNWTAGNFASASSYANYTAYETAVKDGLASTKDDRDKVVAAAEAYAVINEGSSLTDGRLPFNPAGDNTKFGLAFQLEAIENLGVEIGFAFTLPTTYEYAKGQVGNEKEFTVKYNAPIEIGLGASFNADPFEIKFRAGAKLGEKYTSDQDMGAGAKEDEDYSKWVKEKKFGPQLGFGLLPSFKINDNFTAFLNLGIGFGVDEYMYTDDDGKMKYFNATQVDWFINPYVTLNLSGGTFMVGVKIADDGAIKQGKAGGADKKVDYDKETRKVNTLKWEIPIGITFGF